METIISLANFLHDQGCDEASIAVLVDIATSQLMAAKRRLTVGHTIEVVSDTQFDVTIDLYETIEGNTYLYHSFRIIVHR